MTKTVKCVLGLLIITSYLNITNAAGVTQISRYSVVKNEASIAQVNPLLAVQQMRFTQDVFTIRQAVVQWLRHTGYSLVDISKQSKATKEILNQPLPHVVRELGPISAKDGLEVLLGKDVFHLVQDPLHRKVNFELNNKYKQIFKVRG